MGRSREPSERCAVVSKSPAATERLGAAVGRLLAPGDLVLLVGPYGAGKTCFTRGIARGAGVKDLRGVTSPTFVLMNVYEGRVRVFHLDCHRLLPAEVVDLGLPDLLRAGAVVIEWGEKAPAGLGENVVRVTFAHAGRTSRRLELAAMGARGRAIVSRLRPARR